ncbi:MAG: hypothetical protein OSB45_12355 [Pseudomonadales bacterium]|nr:hypothetical protein [Pseudomonadales bacterium]
MTRMLYRLLPFWRPRPIGLNWAPQLFNWLAEPLMTIATIDALAGGNRVICGIAVSGPQIVEGWYGQP